MDSLDEASDTDDVDPTDEDPDPNADGEGSGGASLSSGVGEESTGDVPDPSAGSTSGADPDTDGSESSGDVEDPFVPSLVQAAFNPASGQYEFGFNSIPEMPITGAPDDVDWARWAMLHDGSHYRLYFLPQDEADQLLQFAFNPDTGAYEYGFHSIPAIPIVGAPAEVDPSSIAMLHDGTTYRLYFLSEDDPLRLIQFGFDATVNRYVYGHDSIPQIPVTGTPAGADWSGWDMLHDGSTYRLYAFASASHDSLVQHGFNGGSYEWGWNSIPQIDLAGIPAHANTDDFAMLHDGADYRLYFLTAPQ